MALAGGLGLDIYVVTLSSPTMTDETLRQLLNTAGTRSVLLLEDVDAAFVDRTAAAGAASGTLTFSGLLNAIDGVAAQEGRLLFMTTNHISRLSNALIRPGRVDVRYFLGPATSQQARDLFVSFYRDLPHLPLQQQRGSQMQSSTRAEYTAVTEAVCEPDDGRTPAATGDLSQQQRQHEVIRSMAKQCAAAWEAAERDKVLQELANSFSRQLPAQGGVSMAQLQGYLMTHRKNPWAAAANVQQLLQQEHQ